MLRIRKTHLIVAAAALVAVGGFAAMRGKPGNAGLAAPRQAALEFTQADLFIVEPRSLERALPLTGTLMTLTEATVKAKVAGELVEVPVREGQSVARGQVIAREPHLHMTLSNPRGAFGGHLEKGCKVLYRAELTIAKFSGVALARTPNREGVPVMQRK